MALGLCSLSYLVAASAYSTTYDTILVAIVVHKFSTFDSRLGIQSIGLLSERLWPQGMAQDCSESLQYPESCMKLASKWNDWTGSKLTWEIAGSAGTLPEQSAECGRQTFSEN